MLSLLNRRNRVIHLPYYQDTQCIIKKIRTCILNGDSDLDMNVNKASKRVSPFVKGLERRVGRSKGLKHVHSQILSGLRPLQREVVRAAKRSIVTRHLGYSCIVFK